MLPSAEAVAGHHNQVDTILSGVTYNLNMGFPSKQYRMTGLQFLSYLFATEGLQFLLRLRPHAMSDPDPIHLHLGRDFKFGHMARIEMDMNDVKGGIIFLGQVDCQGQGCLGIPRKIGTKEDIVSWTITSLLSRMRGALQDS